MEILEVFNLTSAVAALTGFALGMYIKAGSTVVTLLVSDRVRRRSCRICATPANAVRRGAAAIRIRPQVSDARPVMMPVHSRPPSLSHTEGAD